MTSTLLAHMGPAYPALRELRSVCLPRPALGFFIRGHHAMVNDLPAARSADERGHSVTPRSISINNRANSAATLR
jgi:hypothetical protein